MQQALSNEIELLLYFLCILVEDLGGNMNSESINLWLFKTLLPYKVKFPTMLLVTSSSFYVVRDPLLHISCASPSIASLIPYPVLADV